MPFLIVIFKMWFFSLELNENIYGGKENSQIEYTLQPITVSSTEYFMLLFVWYEYVGRLVVCLVADYSPFDTLLIYRDCVWFIYIDDFIIRSFLHLHCVVSLSLFMIARVISSYRCHEYIFKCLYYMQQGLKRSLYRRHFSVIRRMTHVIDFPYSYTLPLYSIPLVSCAMCVFRFYSFDTVLFMV